jgi:hypothetical protein
MLGLSWRQAAGSRWIVASKLPSSRTKHALATTSEGSEVSTEPTSPQTSPHSLALLCARRERPCDDRAANKRDELAPAT